MKYKDKTYIIVLECDIVMERCSGYLCEKSFNERTGGFSKYSKNKDIRAIFLTCGGCCGLATHRKVAHLVKQIGKQEKISKDKIVVQMASCITEDNYHGPKCPHLPYIKELIEKLGIDCQEDTYICSISEKKRQLGKYST
ncbi:MAG: CGGC domain-containing protein [Candidatus Ancaeobacter aquaticus]|nr:CGGC domain-containing protein [Candidatus Ancaeobacter aquaticus]